jgi:hypothetical protein
MRHRAARIAVALPFTAIAVSAALYAQGITREEALAAVFPGASIRAEQVFLTAGQRQAAATRAGSELPTALVARYIATQSDAVVGRSYADTHTVRTKKETLLISLDAAGRVKRVDVTAFLEPGEYRAPDAWLRQYGNRPLDEDLGLHRAIRPIAGATLTARAINSAVRRALAIDAVLATAGSPR